MIQGENDDGIAKASFSAMEPSMCQLDDNLRNRLLMTLNVLIYDVVRSLVQAGQEMTAICCSISAAMTTAFEEGAEESRRCRTSSRTC